jgi:hypothetical protein
MLDSIRSAFLSNPERLFGGSATPTSIPAPLITRRTITIRCASPKLHNPGHPITCCPARVLRSRLTVEGVYDYFCARHEMAGMVGRIIVGKAVGPGTLPFDHFKAEHRAWQEVPPAARQVFPAIEDILRKKIVPLKLSV